jgi:hypothetical protein
MHASTQFRMPLITSIPFFINAPQFDMFNLMCVFRRHVCACMRVRPSG